MVELPNYFYEKMAVLLENQPNSVFYLIRNCYLIGSTVAGNILDLEDDNDIDLYYYEIGKHKKNNMNKLYNSLALNERLNIDLLSRITTDEFYSKDNKCLTDYIFNEKKEVFSKKAGQIRALNLEGLFLTKIVVSSCRSEERDRLAIKAILKEWNNILPKETEFAIKEYNLIDYFNEFK